MEDKELREILKLLQRLRGSTTEESTQLQREDLETAAKSIQSHYEAKIVETKLQAKIDELDITPSHASVDMAAYKQNRRAELVAQLELKKEKH